MLEIDQAERIVVKIGSALIVDKDNNLRQKWLQSIIEDIALLNKKGKEVVLVSSGSVALGRSAIKSAGETLKIEEKQAAAACGQAELMRNYQKLFNDNGLNIAQILLTLFDSENRRNYLNAKNTIETLLDNGIVPIINENDTVATHSIRFGDNDRLAARVAQMISGDLLILLSDVDGLYTSNPKLDPKAEHIPVIEEISENIEDMAGDALSSGVGSGGMATKIEAARIAMNGGCNMILGLGTKLHPLKRLAEGGSRSSLFKSHGNPASARKSWIASSLSVSGEIIIDNGAVRALQDGKSLLPAGVIDVKGEFERGDTVLVLDCKLQRIGIGLTAYPTEDAKLIMGHQSHEIEHIIGFSGRNELIHRDDLVVD